MPGEIRGFEYLHRQYGKLSWHTILQPAIHAARHGFIITRELFVAIQSVSENDDFLMSPNWAIDFAPNGTLLRVGDVMTRRRYADTLEKISIEGPDAFYRGKMAQAMIRSLAQSGGIMTEEDLKGYSSVSMPPIMINYRGFNVYGCGAPASGAVTLSVLKILEGYSDFGEKGHQNLDTHRLDEAVRFGYGKVIHDSKKSI